MAVQAGRAALTASALPAADVRWVLHAGSGYQGSMGWPVHHYIQHGIVGPTGNALEIKQYCSAGLTTWIMAAGMLAIEGGAAICTGADNWAWGDRFAAYHAVGGEPFSDVAHATVLTRDAGFAAILGHGTASCPGQAEGWRTRDEFWQHASMDDYQDTYQRVIASRSIDAERDSRQMLAAAVRAALATAGLSPQYVTHFIPHGSASGEPYRSLAKAAGLPWSEELQANQLDQGYLTVSTQVAGLVHLAEAGLPTDAIVLLLAAEYHVSATAVVLHITRTPRIDADGDIRVVS